MSFLLSPFFFNRSLSVHLLVAFRLSSSSGVMLDIDLSSAKAFSHRAFRSFFNSLSTANDQSIDGLIEKFWNKCLHKQ